MVAIGRGKRIELRNYVSGFNPKTQKHREPQSSEVVAIYYQFLCFCKRVVLAEPGLKIFCKSAIRPQEHSTTQ